MTVNKLTTALPLLLLLLALSTVFLFGNDRGYLYQTGHHDTVTALALTLAANLSPDHHFLGFYRQTLDAYGASSYEVYNRYPIGGSLLIKLAIFPFGNDLSAQLYAARLLMLLFFTATAVLAYLSLARLTAHRWIALTATLLTFSSTYCLYYNDMVHTSVVPDLFGVFLVFHGMVIFVQEDRFRQLLGKTCLALLLGWHVYALLLPFIGLGLAGALVQAGRGAWEVGGGGGVKPRCFVALGVVALLVGTAMLSVNFANEYFALNGTKSLTDLPSIRSILARTGLIGNYYDAHLDKWMAWPFFLRSQFHRIGGLFLPYYLTGVIDHGPYPGNTPWGLYPVIGIAAPCACLIGLVFVRPQILWATLVLSGFCWGLPIRHSTAFHDFESLFYIGLPLVFFSLVLLSIHRLSGRRLSVMVGLSVVVLLVFVLSSFQMARVGHTAKAIEMQKNVMADFEVIRKMTAGKVVRVPQKSFLESNPCSIRYYLTGSIILLSTEKRGFTDFLISCHRHERAVLLTPENKEVFLYRYDIDQLIEDGKPLIHAGYSGNVVDVYRSDNLLYYVRSPRPQAPLPRFFLHLIPVDADDLPDGRKQYGYDNLDFYFKDERIPHGTRAIAVRELPDYAVARISTGQSTSEGLLWEAEVRFAE